MLKFMEGVLWSEERIFGTTIVEIKFRVCGSRDLLSEAENHEGSIEDLSILEGGVPW